jgi:hypothetical protein
MKKLLNICLIFCLFSNVIIGQDEFFSTHDKTSIGIKLVDGGEKVNSKLCQVSIKNGVSQYSPYEVVEYGLKDGRIYQSKEIHISDTVKRVFLERLTTGRIILYYYRSEENKTFFLEKDSAHFFEIPKLSKEKISYKKQLLDITSDCANVAFPYSVVSYNKRSLTKLISRYNNCILKPFPHFRYGISFGYEFEKLSPASGDEPGYINKFNFKYDPGIIIGFYIDNPIAVTDFSIHTELNYSSHGYSFNKIVKDQDFDFVANISTLKLPVLIRYVYPSNRFRPFIDLGGALALNVKNESSIYETTISDKVIIMNGVQESSLIENYLLGYSINAGTECRLGNRSSLFFELGYSKYHGLSDVHSVKVSDIKFSVGVSF